MLVKQSFSRFFNLILLLALTLFLAGCPMQNNDQEETTKQPVAEEKNKSDSSAQTKKAAPTPQVSTSTSQESKPISDYSGNAEDFKHDELYLVPNHFPIEDREKQQQQEDEKQETEEQQDPPTK